MKIIFLDIDGVLSLNLAVNGYFHFSKKCLNNLKKILIETEAKIVLSSTRRLSNKLRVNYKNELGKAAFNRYHYGQTPYKPLLDREMEIFERIGTEGTRFISVENRIAIDDDIGDMQNISEI
jgi:hypothetical protein